MDITIYQTLLPHDDPDASLACYRDTLGFEVRADVSVAGARFWVSTASEDLQRFSPDVIGGATGRMLLVVDDPESLLSAAVAAGATQTSPVGEEHGWRLRRFEAPFGHEWEVGRPPGPWPPASG